MPEVNQEIATHLIRESLTKRTPYRHMNHKSRKLSQPTYLNHSEWKQHIHVPRNTKVCITQSYDNNSLPISSDRNTPQKINLGWSDPFLARQFYISLGGSYRLVSMRMTISQREDTQNRKRDQALSSVSFEDKAF